MPGIELGVGSLSRPCAKLRKSSVVILLDLNVTTQNGEDGALSQENPDHEQNVLVDRHLAIH